MSKGGKMLRKIFFVFLCAGLVSAVSLTELSKFLAYSNIQGDFTLDRMDVNLPVPMQFTGSFEIKSGELWIWAKTPIQANLKINPSGIFYQVQNTYQRLDGQNNPMDSKLFQKAMNFDLSALQDYFSLRLNGDKNFWTLQLVPKKEMGISVIEIDGEKFIRSIFIKEKNGSTSTLKLHIKTLK